MCHLPGQGTFLIKIWHESVSDMCSWDWRIAVSRSTNRAQYGFFISPSTLYNLAIDVHTISEACWAIMLAPLLSQKIMKYATGKNNRGCMVGRHVQWSSETPPSSYHYSKCILKYIVLHVLFRVVYCRQRFIINTFVMSARKCNPVIQILFHLASIYQFLSLWNSNSMSVACI